jgi:hypothetical protein
LALVDPAGRPLLRLGGDWGWLLDATRLRGVGTGVSDVGTGECSAVRLA